MKAFIKAILPLCLLSSPSLAQQSGEAEPKKVGCITHITMQDKALRLKGAVLITQMMNSSYFVRTYVASIPNEKGKEERVAVFIMAVKSDEAPELPTRIKCVRETDNQEFELLQLVFPLNEGRA